MLKLSTQKPEPKTFKEQVQMVTLSLRDNRHQWFESTFRKEHELEVSSSGPLNLSYRFKRYTPYSDFLIANNELCLYVLYADDDYTGNLNTVGIYDENSGVFNKYTYYNIGALSDALLNTNFDYVRVELRSAVQELRDYKNELEVFEKLRDEKVSYDQIDTDSIRKTTDKIDRYKKIVDKLIFKVNPG